eukprot:Awhi_evm1s4791
MLVLHILKRLAEVDDGNVNTEQHESDISSHNPNENIHNSNYNSNNNSDNHSYNYNKNHENGHASHHHDSYEDNVNYLNNLNVINLGIVKRRKIDEYRIFTPDDLTIMLIAHRQYRKRIG